MNYFRRDPASLWVKDDRCDCCEHVEADRGVAYMAWGEFDSFGPIGVTLYCEACYDAACAAYECHPVQCCDCGQLVARKSTREWRWYDFYAAQGDEPLIVCDECWKKPKHVARMAKDRSMIEAEADL